jgi:hypothetical protein
MTLAFALCLPFSFAHAAEADGGRAVKMAQTRLGPGQRVLLRGCVEQAVPEFCRRLGGYNVTGAQPPIPVGMFVELAGDISTNVSPCPGTVLVNIQYTPSNTFCQ